MSELIKNNCNGVSLRWKLVTSASALALTAYISSTTSVGAKDGEGPLVWLEVGGQLERTAENQQPYTPIFVQSLIADGIIPIDNGQRSHLSASGFEGAALIQPRQSDWHFLAAVRYGRSNSTQAAHKQTNNPPQAKAVINFPQFHFYHTAYVSPIISRKFGNLTAQYDERHLVLDFQAGKDLGLGLFGGADLVEIGVRFAQFTNKSKTQITANSGPDWIINHPSTFNGLTGTFTLPTESWDWYHAKASISRSFSGVGPSLAFKTSVSLVGNQDEGQISFDLGANGAVLFGRQKTKAHYTTTDQRPYLPHPDSYKQLYEYYGHQHDVDRSHIVAVPDVGGFAAVSFRYNNAKISVGYRADFFIGAVDGGIDSRKMYDRNFYGPFATVSVGLGG